MKLSISKSIIALVLGAGLTAQAGIFTYSGGSYSIPDGSLAGVSSQISVSGLNYQLADITVTLNLSGGYNGDLYAYLSYDGKLVPLLNRIGVTSGNAFGSSGAGMTVTFNDFGSLGDIHSAGNGVLNGAYQADGRNISPLSSGSSFDSASRATLDGTFGFGVNPVDPNGVWTLFFADVSSGGGTATLNSWSLNITAVPEPVNVALGCFTGVFLVVSLVRSQRLRKLIAAR